MMYRHIPHPHIAARRLQGPVHRADVTSRNDRLGLWITKSVGTMWCAYVFCLISLTSLPSVIESHSVTLLVSWVAQTFLQLVLLSVILVGQNLTGAASDKRADQTFMDAEAVLAESLKIQQHLMAQDAILTGLTSLHKPPGPA
jgi:hypothetical protein